MGDFLQENHRHSALIIIDLLLNSTGKSHCSRDFTESFNTEQNQQDKH